MPEASITLLILLGLCRDKRVFTTSHFMQQLTHVLVSQLSLHKLDKQEAATTNQIEVSGIPKILGHLITYCHPLTFPLDCFRFTQTVRYNVSFVIEQVITYNLLTRQYPRLLPLSPTLLGSSGLDVRQQA